jgi:excinuclease ABC subunit A
MAKTVPAPLIRLRGVRQNNLKNFDLDLPLGRLIVITGPSGSGKSSLAFDTLFAEGQRRYIETFSPYARQFFDRMDKPQVDRIEGIPPAIAIEQRNTIRTTRSTVGTLTELCDYMKLLWPQLAQLFCRSCGQPVRPEPPQVIWDTLQAQPDVRDADLLVAFDLALSEKLSLEESLRLVAKQGYQRLLMDGEVVRVEEAPQRLGKSPRRIQRLTIVQDRLRLNEANRARLIEACEQAYHFGKGKLAVWKRDPAADAPAPKFQLWRRFSTGLHCAQCDLDYREPTPALFSFNHPLGACPTCKGFGRIITIDHRLAIPDRSKTLRQGAVRPWQSGFSAECQQDLLKFCRARGVPVDVPFAELTPEQQRWVIEGDPDYGIDEAHEWPYAWYGVKGYFKWLESKAYKMHVRVLLSRYRAYSTCPDCAGQRFNPEALCYRLPVEGLPWPDATAQEPLPTQPGAAQRLTSLSLADFYALPIESALKLVEALAARRPFQPHDPLATILAEVQARLSYLVEVGLGYLTLDRPTRTLSGGETERVSLTTCLGTRLVNTLYVLDEPSVGLHPRDTARLVRILERLRDLGNTVVVVEHEAGVIRAADQVVDLGPGSGEAGGYVVFQGTLDQLKRCTASLTGAYLSGRKQIDPPPRRPVLWPPPQPGSLPATPEPAAGRNASSTAPARAEGEIDRSVPGWLVIRGAKRFNLKNLTVHIPLNRLVCLTGVSGSGKTTLVREVLLPALQARLGIVPELTKASDRLGAEDENDVQFSSPNGEPRTVELIGWEQVQQVVLVDQSPIGRTPRSNPLVYIGAFDALRELFAQTDLAVQRGLSASAFSFNSAQGQCERCRGAGFEKVEMQFLSDVFIRCPDCNGRRYRSHILEVKLPVAAPRPIREILPSGAAVTTARVKRRPARQAESRPLAWSIADFLDATANEAIEALAPYADTAAGRRVLDGLRLLQEVGLGYLRLGQPINTLSGGECQRLKLVSHLAEAAVLKPALRAQTSRITASQPPGSRLQPKRTTLFLLDEPTTGLHFDDVRLLLKVLHRLVDEGHSVLVIEHNLDVIRSADWIIDLGPEAGDRGGQIVVTGTPEQVAACPASHTGRALQPLLAASPCAQAAA